MKTIYEKPEAQLRPSVIRCSILAGSTGQGTGNGKDVTTDPGLDARRRGGSLENVSEGKASDVKNALSF